MDNLVVIEDSAPVRLRIAAYLEQEGFRVLQAESGEEGLELIASSRPEVILCDLALPDLSGIEVLRRVRHESSLPFMPAIMISVRQRTEEIVNALRFAEEYLIKPINLVELRARVQSMLRLKRNHEVIRIMNSQLEERVMERTRELAQAIESLRHEIKLRTRSEAEVIRLSHRVIEARELERAAVAREIHDVMGTNLLTLKLMFQTAWHEMDPHGINRERRREILELIDSTTEGARGLSRGLSPLAVEGVGLCGALSGLTETYRRTQQELRFETQLPTEEPELDVQVSIHAYRIVQEALANAVRHSGATRIKIALDSSVGLCISIEDNGCGFENKENGSGIGLLIMRQRAQAIQAALEVESTVGRGTRVLLVRRPA